MPSPLCRLTSSTLRALSRALLSDRLVPPYTSVGLIGLAPGGMASDLAEYLGGLHATGWRADQIAGLVAAVADARSERQADGDLVELVWSGPEVLGIDNRDKGVVVRDLFGRAEESILLSAYSVHQGRELFHVLAERMKERPALRVELFLDIRRDYQDAAPESVILNRFAQRFVNDEWPVDAPLPMVYYDPRSLLMAADVRSCLHAKCVVVDRRIAFVTSANFTEAAQNRNIEVGAMIHIRSFAESLADQFCVLLRAGTLKRLQLIRAGARCRSIQLQFGHD